jgi:drug/metabolite transporter (DMT)-like permease
MIATEDIRMAANVQAIPIKSGASAWVNQIILYGGIFAGAWASVLARMAQAEGIPTTYLVAFRMVAGTLALTPFVLSWHRQEVRRIRRAELIACAAAGFWMAVQLVLGFDALRHTSVLVSGVLVGTNPLWIALLEVRLLKAKLNRWMWVGLFITFAGGLMITLSGSSDFKLGDNPMLGSVLSIIAAFAAAFYAIIGRHSRGKIAFLPYLWFVFVGGSIASLVMVLLSHAPLTGYSAKGYFYLVLLTILPQIIAHSTYNYCIRELSATYTSVVSQLGTIISAGLAFVFFSELPGKLELPGSIAILAGIVLVNLGQARYRAFREKPR